MFREVFIRLSSLAADTHFTRGSQKQLFIDPHEGACVVGFALVLDAVEAVPPLAVVPLVVVVELDLPDGLEQTCLSELSSTETTHQAQLLFLHSCS